MADIDPCRHLTEEELVWHYYEAGSRAEVQSHLDRCRECAAEFRTLQAAMASLDAFSAPNRGADYEDQLWRSLVKREPSLAGPRRWFRSMFPGMFAARRLAWCMGLAAMLCIAFLAGRLSTKGRAVAELAATPDAVRERLLVNALTEHLERSERILLEIDNRQLRNEREQAENLLAANRLYRQTAELEGQSSLAATLEDLERVLIEVARSPDRPSPGQVRELQVRMEEQDLLFQVQALGLRLRQIDQHPVPAGRVMPPTKSMKG